MRYSVSDVIAQRWRPGMRMTSGLYRSCAGVGSAAWPREVSVYIAAAAAAAVAAAADGRPAPRARQLPVRCFVSVRSRLPGRTAAHEGHVLAVRKPCRPSWRTWKVRLVRRSRGKIGIADGGCDCDCDRGESVDPLGPQHVKKHDFLVFF